MWVNKGLILAKKSVKEKHFFDLTFTDVHMGRQNVPKSIFYVKNHSNLSDFFFIEEY